MAKAVKHSEMAKEIRKDYLLRHLDEVEKLITDWIPQISAPVSMAVENVSLLAEKLSHLGIFALDNSNLLIGMMFTSATRWQ